MKTKFRDIPPSFSFRPSKIRRFVTMQPNAEHLIDFGTANVIFAEMRLDFERIGGDEFAIIVDANDPARHTAVIADAVVAVLAEPYAIGLVVHVGASIGVRRIAAASRNSELRWKRRDKRRKR